MLRALIAAILMLIVVVAAGFSGAVVYVFQVKSKFIANGAVELTSLRSQLDQSNVVLDTDGNAVGMIGGENRRYVELHEIPDFLKQAFISAEDSDFYQHPGFSIKGIIRSFLANLEARQITQGGSTITQQLARSMYLSRERTYLRKLRELGVALALEATVTKDEILEIYLNMVYLGYRSYGVAAASLRYFSKDLSELKLHEAALLAALPKAPSALAPHRNYDAAMRRQRFVLARMFEDGFIDAKIYNEVIDQPVTLSLIQHGSLAPVGYYVDAVQRELSRQFSIDLEARRGYVIESYLDYDVQTRLPEVLDHFLEQTNFPYEQRSLAAANVQAAAVILDNRTGGVIAIQGGRAYHESQFNRATLSKRPLGSLFMPLYFALGVERGYSLAMPLHADYLVESIQDLSRQRDEWPSLYEGLLQERLHESSRFFASLGVGNVTDFAARLGLVPQRRDLSLALGEVNASVVELATSFSVFGRKGAIMTPHFIKRVIADDHRLVYERDELASSQRVVSESTCYIMTRVMNDAWQELMDEQGSHVIGHWAGYAGSHHGLHDAWAVAYSSDFTIGVWIGAERGEVKVAQDSKAARQLVAKLWQQVYMAAGDKVVLGKAWETPADVGFIRVPVKGRQAHRFIPTSLINTHAL